MMKNFFVFILLIFIVCVMTSCIFNEEYSVRSVESHYEHKNENSQTQLIIYVSGSSGHVEKLFCEFAPGVKVEGIKRVRKKGKARKWQLGSVSYYCDRVE